MASTGTRHRRSVRLPAYDYAAPGAYFVTVCTHGRRCLFGTVREHRTELSREGGIVAACWEALPRHFPAVRLDAFVVMPNHVHGILRIIPSADSSELEVGAQHAVPLRADRRYRPPTRAFGTMTPQSLAAIVRAFKSSSTREINRLRGTPGAALWQRNYHEHVVRNEEDLNAIRRYIADNPPRWHLDPEHPERKRRARTRPVERLRGE
jgi:REP element-mobilizing transposase RayT